MGGVGGDVHRQIRARVPPDPGEHRTATVQIVLQTQEFAPLGSECRIQLYPLGRSRGALVASGRIVREGQEGLGIEFENLPHETFESVRTLILGSAEEPELVENELLNRLSMPPGQY